MDRDRLQFYSLYVSRFAGGFGFSALALLLPKYANELVASDLMIGLFYTGFTATQALVVVPLAWAGDRYDKRDLPRPARVRRPRLRRVHVRRDVLAARRRPRRPGRPRHRYGAVEPLAGRRTRRQGHPGEPHREGQRLAVRRLPVRVRGSRLPLRPLRLRAHLLRARGAVVVAFAAVWFLLDADDSRVRGFPFSDLAVNRRILTLTSFRAQYAVAVTLVRSWVAVYAGLEAARGGLAASAPVLGELSPAFVPLLVVNGLLGVADSVREPASMRCSPTRASTARASPPRSASGSSSGGPAACSRPSSAAG